MGTHLKLTASDGHKFGAYRVDPAGTPKGGMVVIQEILGVNRHIRSVARDNFEGKGRSVIVVHDDRSIRGGLSEPLGRSSISLEQRLPVGCPCLSFVHGCTNGWNVGGGDSSHYVGHDVSSAVRMEIA